MFKSIFSYLNLMVFLMKYIMVVIIVIKCLKIYNIVIYLKLIVIYYVVILGFCR